MTAPARYFGDFDGYQSLIANFMDGGWDYDAGGKKTIPLPADFPTDEQILFAAYGTEEAYSGSAIVVFRQPNGDLFVASGSHCSCNGLEGEWSPSKTTVEALAKERLGAPEDSDYWSRDTAYDTETRQAYRDLIARLTAEADAGKAVSP